VVVEAQVHLVLVVLEELDRLFQIQMLGTEVLGKLLRLEVAQKHLLVEVVAHQIQDPKELVVRVVVEMDLHRLEVLLRQTQVQVAVPVDQLHQPAEAPAVPVLSFSNIQSHLSQQLQPFNNSMQQEHSQYLQA
jgi:hypothetical protein